MRFDVMTLFPEEVDAFLSSSIIGIARKNGFIEVNCHNIRDYTEDKHRRVDDYPYGGGKGMLMQAAPVMKCFENIKSQVDDAWCIYLSPKGKRFTQTKAKKLLKKKNLILLCGHYEGIDQRALDSIVDEEISIGDYVLSGGELGAMVIVDAVSRMVEGVLADESCYKDESIYSGLLEYPQYTRPPVFEGESVPDVLLSGDHKKIADWRFEQSLEVTKQKRPDLYRRYMNRASVKALMAKKNKKKKSNKKHK